MHDLIPLGPALLPGILTVAEIDSAIGYAEAEKAIATRAAYASDWKEGPLEMGAPEVVPARAFPDEGCYSVQRPFTASGRQLRRSSSFVTRAGAAFL